MERVALGPLSEPETAELAAAWLGGPAPPGLTAALHRRTAGNPLFIEELARHLADEYRDRPADELLAAAAMDVPQGVRSVIDRRVARLPEAARQGIGLAAVVGQDFALGDVAAAADVDEDRFADGLDAAVAARIVEESSPAGHYRFAHALVRETVLMGLGATRRALLHRRLAEVLESLPASLRERRLPELADHLLEARPMVDAGKAAQFALRAARQVTQRLAYEDAAGLIERGLGGELDEGDRLRIELLLELGDARWRSGEAPSATECFRQAADAARVEGDAELIARAALGAAGLSVVVGPVRAEIRALLEEALAGLPPASELRAQLLARLAIEVYYEPPATLREQLSAEALAAGRRIGGRALLEALGARHVALWSADHTEERLAIADELIAVAGSLGQREAELQGFNWRVVDLVELGRFDAAQQAIAEHERLAGDLRLPAYAWYGPLWRAMLALVAGRLEEAERLSREGDRIGRTAHDENAALLFEVQRLAIRQSAGSLTSEDHELIRRRSKDRPPGPAWRAWTATTALNRGDTEHAAATVRRDAQTLASFPRDAEWLYTATTLGVVAAWLRDAEAAAAIYPCALPYARRVVTAGRAAVCTGSASLSLGLLAATLGDERAAVAHLEEAVTCNDELGAVPLAAGARHALAGVLGGDKRAAALEGEARAAAESVGMELPGGLLQRI